MPRVVHVVSTRRFAGVEHYITDVAVETASRGWDVVVVGGNPQAMRHALGESSRWLPGRSPAETLVSLLRLGAVDVCHAHMTKAEALSVWTRPFHRAPVVATRHFAEHRGKTLLGRTLGPSIAARLARQIAVSDYVASTLEAPPDVVIPNAVRPRSLLWRLESRIVVTLQRLEPEKDTLTALKAWRESGLACEGWTLRIVGDGSERLFLEQWVADNSVAGVEFAGWSYDPESELAEAGFLFASAGSEPGGLAVLEAMSAGVPVVAAAAGGHLETIGKVGRAPGFAPGDIFGAAECLRALTDDALRRELSAAVLAAASARITLPEHVDRLIHEYRSAGAAV